MVYRTLQNDVVQISAAKRPVRPTTTLTIARPENALKTMGRVKVVRVLQYRGRSVLLDCRVLKTK